MDVKTKDCAKQSSKNIPNIDFFCGWCAGCVETCLLFPISKMTFRQQLYGVVFKEALAQIFKEGVPYLYRGLLPPLIQRTSARMVMFGMFDTFQRLLDCHKDNTFTLCYSTSALLAGTTEALLCPLERIQILLQTVAYHKKFRNTGDVFMFLRQYGIHEYYRGLSLIILRNSLSNVLFFTLREPLKEKIVKTFSKQSNEKTNVEIINNKLEDYNWSHCKKKKIYISTLLFHASNFISGAVLGATISTVFFPINVVKHRMQSFIGEKFISPVVVFNVIWNERNKSFKSLYRGVHLNFTRSLLTWGITNSVYEYLKLLIKSVF